jgi:hypothetical protein
MESLVDDILHIIISHDEYIWYQLYLVDKRVCEYTHTPNGRKKYVELATKYTKRDDVEEWRLFGRLHRENDLPARVRVNSYYEWIYNGNIHRDGDNPAIISPFGHGWYQHGRIHRENDQPALTNSFGGNHWYYNGMRHRDNDNPAIISSNMIVWYKNGLRHRIGNPANIESDGTKVWWENGIRIKCVKVHPIQVKHLFAAEA